MSSFLHLHIAVCWARLMFKQSKKEERAPSASSNVSARHSSNSMFKIEAFLTMTAGIFHLSLLPLKVTAWPLTAGALLHLQKAESSSEPSCQRWDSTHFHTQQQRRHRRRLGSLIGPWEKTVRPKIHYAFNRWLTSPSWTCVPGVLQRFFRQFTSCTHTVEQGNHR